MRSFPPVVAILLITIEPTQSFIASRFYNNGRKVRVLQPALFSISIRNDEEQTTPRRRKKNKYESFSKAATSDKDPFEALMEESVLKNKALIEEKDNELKQKQAARQVQVAPLPSLEFPDTQAIDPYDPQTFGYIQIATIIGAHGVHGWLKVRCTTDFPVERLCQPGIRHVKPAQKRAPRQMVLVAGRQRHLDEYLIQMEGIETRDAAQRLRGAVLYVREEQLLEESAEQEQEEYLVADLVGLQVFLQDDEESSNHEDSSENRQFVGHVGGVVFAEELCSLPGLGHDYLEIILPRGIGGTQSFRDELVLIPLVPQIVPHIDLEGKAVYIDPPDGLLDLTYVREEKTRIKGFLASAD
jgi:16S rRNA processing protein RimM